MKVDEGRGGFGNYDEERVLDGFPKLIGIDISLKAVRT